MYVCMQVCIYYEYHTKLCYKDIMFMVDNPLFV